LARFRRDLHPVNSLKHVVDTSGVTSEVVSVTDIANAVDAPVRGTSNNVNVGCVINFIFLVVEIVGAVAYAAVPRVYMCVNKNPANEIGTLNPDSIGVQDTRKFVIHQEMMMVSQQASSAGGGDFTFPRTMFKGVIRIPRHMRRMGLDDRIQMRIMNDSGASTGTTRWCMQAIYKEIY